MLITHPSHYGLDLIATTLDNVVLSGTLTDCKRMAAAHGMEVASIEGQILGTVGGVATYAAPDPKSPNRILYAGGGMIQRCRDDYALLIPRKIWEAK